MFADLVILSTLCALATGSCLDTNSGKVTCKAFVCLKLCGKGLKHVDVHCQGSCGVCDNKALAVQQTPPSVPSLTPVLTAVNATSFRIAWTLSAEKTLECSTTHLQWLTSNTKQLATTGEHQEGGAQMIRKSAILSVKKIKFDHSNYHANQYIYAKVRTKNVFGACTNNHGTKTVGAPF